MTDLQECLIIDQNMEEPASTSVAGGQAVWFSSRHPGRDHNEDSAAILGLGPELAVLAVADGVGGAPDGERASHDAILALEQELRAHAEDKSVRESVLNGIDAAQRKVTALGGSTATTLALVEIHENHIRTYHAGDTEILLTSNRGRIKWRTIPHSPVGYAVQAGLLNDREAIRSADRHLVSNVLGADPMTIEISSRMELAPRDTVLVATDGLLDNLIPDEVSEAICTGDLQQAVQELVKTAQRRMKLESGKPDDLSLIAWRPQPSSNA